jgi:hypothetical protein
MTDLRAFLVLPVLLACAMPVQAQLLFKKKGPVPAQRVPELILTLKTEADERKRAAAAEELRDYDPKTFTEIVPLLVDTLMNDKKQSVRLEALNSLARLRPVTQVAGRAIEHVASEDESLRLRLQAKSALLKYHIAGYRSEPIASTPAKQETPSVTIPAVAFPPTPLGMSSMPPDVPRPLPKGLALPSGQTPPPPVIQLEGPSLSPRPH